MAAFLHHVPHLCGHRLADDSFEIGVGLNGPSARRRETDEARAQDAVRINLTLELTQRFPTITEVARPCADVVVDPTR